MVQALAASLHGREFRSFQLSLDDHMEDRLPRVAAPTLVVRGQHDPICRAPWVEEVARLLPDGRLVLIPGVAHTLVFTAPEQLAAVSRQFLHDEQASEPGPPPPVETAE